ncbi:ribokinase [Eisenbergiella porci]|uniref:ribokinase n=1 Tax=Eisenbergiella porci TaxID=2652274 RepID=UPI002A81B82E|nr:ribokinase [Eisenbergiella porci]
MGIINFGSLNIDRVYKVSHFVRPGETISSESYKCFPGGKGLNQSIAISRAGAKVTHAGTIGADGGFLKELLKQSGVDTRYVRESENVTGHALIQVSEEGENCIILYKGSNYENDVNFIDYVLAGFNSEDILVLQNEINNLEYLLQCGKQKGMRILLNASPVDERLKNMDLTGVTWLMVNETEGLEITGENKPERIAAQLLDKYPAMNVILTLGTDGCVYQNKENRIYQSCFPAETVDTTAAGDTFTGYFIASVLTGKSMEEALEIASCAAAMAVSREGAAVSIPIYAEVEKKLMDWHEIKH